MGDGIALLRGEPAALAAAGALLLVGVLIGWFLRHLTWTELVAKERRRAFRRGLAAQRRGDDEAFWQDATIHGQMTGDLGAPDKAGPLVTKTGRVVTDAEIEQWADEAERGYTERLDVEP